METVLGKDCLEFAEWIAEGLADNTHIILSDKLIRSVSGMAYRCLEAGCVGYGRDKANELYAALRHAKESRVLIGLCVRGRVFDEAFSNRAQRKIASLCYRISKAYGSSLQEAERHPYRFPSVKILFSTKRLTIRSWKKTDIEPFNALCRDAEYEECAYYCQTDPTVAYERIKRMTDLFVISRKGDGAFIGCISIARDGDGEGRFRLHLGLNSENRGRGYFTEIIDSALEYAAKSLGADIVSVYIPECRRYLTASLLRIGFEQEGVLKGYGKNGENVTVLSMKK